CVGNSQRVQVNIVEPTATVGIETVIVVDARPAYSNRGDASNLPDPGDIVKVVVRMTNTANFERCGDTSTEVMLRYNRNILAFVGDQGKRASEISHDSATKQLGDSNLAVVRIAGLTADAPSDVDTLNFIAMLGEGDSTALALSI